MYRNHRGSRRGAERGRVPHIAGWSSEGIPDTPSEVRPWYAITIRGYSNRVYAGVNPEEEGFYKKLLGKDMFSGYARRGKDNLDAIRQLVPLWPDGDASLG